MAAIHSQSIRRRFFFQQTAILILCVLILIIVGYVFVRSFAATLPLVPNLPIDAPAAEGSGMVASRRYPGVFWWHRDGGQVAHPRDVVYALKLSPSGTQQAVKGTDKFPYYLFADGTTTSTIYNKQWEDIALDNNNDLWIGNIGANGKAGDPDGCGHSQQKLYKVAEPNPLTDTRIPTILAQYGFTFPNPPAGCLTYNSEAMFWLDGKLYIFAKMTNSPVYRIDLPAGTSGTAKLTKLGVMNGIDKISYSSVSYDKRRLMVGGHNGFKVLVSGNSSLTGDAWVKDIIAKAPRWSAKFKCSHAGSPCNQPDGTAEGGSFFADSYSVAFVSESREVYFATPAMYGDSSIPPPPADAPPTVTLTAPTAGATVSGSAVPVTATATDDNAVSKVVFAYKPHTATTWTTLATDTTSPYSAVWNTTTLTDNVQYDVRAVATDSASQTATDSATVTVKNTVTPPPPPPGDTVPPTVSMTVTPTSVATGGAVTATATASDNVGVTKVEFLVDNYPKCSDTTAPYTCSWDTKTSGLKSLQAVAYDAAGNSTTSTAVSLSVGTVTNGSGDANGDSRVNALDLSIVLSHDGQNYGPADFNKDGTVGSADLAILLGKWTW